VFEQRFGQTNHRVTVLIDDLCGALVLLSDDLADFCVDANCSFFREVTVLSDLAAEEICLPFAEVSGPSSDMPYCKPCTREFDGAQCRSKRRS
jgi:hypothetical protein